MTAVFKANKTIVSYSEINWYWIEEGCIECCNNGCIDIFVDKDSCEEGWIACSDKSCGEASGDGWNDTNDDTTDKGDDGNDDGADGDDECNNLGNIDIICFVIILGWRPLFFSPFDSS